MLIIIVIIANHNHHCHHHVNINISIVKHDSALFRLQTCEPNRLVGAFTHKKKRCEVMASPVIDTQ